jgi:hypothetical protein
MWIFFYRILRKALCFRSEISEILLLILKIHVDNDYIIDYINFNRVFENQENLVKINIVKRRIPRWNLELKPLD